MRRPCVAPGCKANAGRYIDYCAQHMNIMRKCVIDGCERTVATWSRSGCCCDHRAEGRKLRP